MRENILIGLAVLILATMWIQIANTNTKSRYDVVTGSNMIKKQVKLGETVFVEKNQTYLDAGKK